MKHSFQPHIQHQGLTVPSVNTQLWIAVAFMAISSAVVIVLGLA
jgi:hypothetical protein